MCLQTCPLALQLPSILAHASYLSLLPSFSLAPLSFCLFFSWFFLVKTNYSTGSPLFFFLPLSACWCSCPYLASLRTSGSWIWMWLCLCVCVFPPDSESLLVWLTGLTKTHSCHGDNPPSLPISLSISLPVSLWFLSPWGHHCIPGSPGTVTWVILKLGWGWYNSEVGYWKRETFRNTEGWKNTLFVEKTLKIKSRNQQENRNLGCKTNMQSSTINRCSSVDSVEGLHWLRQAKQKLPTCGSILRFSRFYCSEIADSFELGLSFDVLASLLGLGVT